MSTSPTASPADALIQTSAPHRRARTAAWSYHFYPDEPWVELVITLPFAILLRQVQIRPHNGALTSKSPFLPSLFSTAASSGEPRSVRGFCWPPPPSSSAVILESWLGASAVQCVIVVQVITVGEVCVCTLCNPPPPPPTPPKKKPNQLVLNAKPCIYFLCVCVCARMHVCVHLCTHCRPPPPAPASKD